MIGKFTTLSKISSLEVMSMANTGRRMIDILATFSRVSSLVIVSKANPLQDILT
jgi:hypothetical protein